MLLHMNAIQNCPVMIEDMKIAECIFGPDMSSLKGKSMRRKPKPARKDLVEIPAEITEKHHDIELCMDTMFINKVWNANRDQQIDPILKCGTE